MKVLLLLLIVKQITALTHIPVEDLEWTITSANGSISVPGKVPGGVYSALKDNDVLNNGEFFYRDNDLTYRWISKTNWSFSTMFQVNAEIMSEERVVFEFDGLDTIAEIIVDDEIVGRSDNMFARHLIDVKEYLDPLTEQNLTVRFESPVNYAQRMYDEWEEEYGYPVLPECFQIEYHQGECHANIIRKMQASFGWDWGPGFPDSGIWLPWRIVGWTSLKVQYVLFSATPSATLPDKPDENTRPEWEAKVQVWFDPAVTTGTISGHIQVQLDGESYIDESQSINFDEVKVDEHDGSVPLSFTFTIPEGTVDLWWPNGYGKQNLYNLKVTWTSDADEVSEKEVNVGFRTVELDQSVVNPSIPEQGTNFFFRINNVKMFLKGNNWIPAHVLNDLVTPEYTKRLLEDTVAANQNCMRVWGGGIYETEVFHETVDKLGILIWQDFMFAVSMYSSDPEFLHSVAKEVKTQVKRIQHHPSILLWAGNNENELALRDSWFGTDGENFEKYRSDYVALYVNTVKNETEKLDTSVPFLVSSPSNGVHSDRENHVAQNPADPKFGDIHHYDYESNGWKWQSFKNPRFASEYGFQSWPVYRTFAPFLAPEDQVVDSDMMLHRMNHQKGLEEFRDQLSTHMVYDPETTSFEHHLYMTQIQQAMSLKTETDHFRRLMNNLLENGEGNTMGALYWQLNSIWPGASWSSIEHGGRWKMSHYFSLQFFSSVYVYPWIDESELNVNVISDLTEDMTDLILTVSMYDYKSFQPVATKELFTEATSQDSVTVVKYNLKDDFAISENCVNGEHSDACIFTTVLRNQDGERVSGNFAFLGEPKNAPLQKAEITIEGIEEIETDQFKITLNSDNVALFVWLETDIDGVFSMNGFLMFEPVKIITFRAREDATVEELQPTIQIMTLSDTF